MDPLTLLAQAKEKILAGDIEGGRALRQQAEELQQVETATKAITPAPADVVRLPFAETKDAPAVSTQDMAVKAAYVKKYGDLDSSTEQVLKELYGTDNYPALLAQKCRVVNRYLKSNRIDDSRLASMVLLTPMQVMAAIMGGVPVEGQYSIKATMVEAQDVLGGVLVPEELNTDMVERLPGLTVVRQRARQFNTSRDALSFLVRTGGNKRYIGALRSRMTSESPTATFNTNATFGKINIPVHVNLSKVPVSKSLLEDASMDILGQVLMPEFTTDAALLEDAQFLTGSGADEPQDILNGILANGAPFNADIQTQTSGSASALLFDAFVAAPYKLAGQYRSRKNPSTAWAFTSATAGIIAGLKDGAGAYLWTEMHGNNAVGAPDTLRGWQVAETEALAEVAANTYPGIFGDFSGYRIVDRIGTSVERYSDASTAETDSVVFFCRRRYGGQVAEGYKFIALKVSV